jgi:hypothetical protein
LAAFSSIHALVFAAFSSFSNLRVSLLSCSSPWESESNSWTYDPRYSLTIPSSTWLEVPPCHPYPALRSSYLLLRCWKLGLLPSLSTKSLSLRLHFLSLHLLCNLNSWDMVRGEDKLQAPSASTLSHKLLPSHNAALTYSCPLVRKYNIFMKISDHDTVWAGLKDVAIFQCTGKLFLEVMLVMSWALVW